MITAPTVSEQHKQMQMFWHGVKTLLYTKSATITSVQNQLEEDYGIKTTMTNTVAQTYSLLSPHIIDEDKYLLFLLKFT
jgi:hypothetical protein